MTKINFNVFSSIFYPIPHEAGEIEENQAHFRAWGRPDFLFYGNIIFVKYFPILIINP